MPMEGQFNPRRPRTVRRVSHIAAISCAALLTTESGFAADGAVSPSASAVSRIAATTYGVQRYELEGNTLLSGDEIQRVFADSTGPAVNLSQIKLGLVRLQQVYRERGFAQAAVTLPRQSLNDGVVKVKVQLGASSAAQSPVSAPQISTWSVPTYDIQHFQIRGNTLLTAEEIDKILGGVTGPAIGEEQLQRALSRLRAAYAERGRSLTAVSLPSQLLTDGLVVIQVTEGPAPAVAVAASTNAAPAAPAVRTFEVNRYDVAGNTLLKPEVVAQVFTNAVGPAVTLPQIQKALGELQLAYRERGFATVSVGLPQQQLTNAVVKVQVTEGALVDIRVLGNKHFDEANVRRTLPSLNTNGMLNSRILQAELDAANQNRDRQIYPSVGPGPEPGTSVLTLRVKDRFPLHGRVDVNNHSTPGTPDWRVNSSLSYGNLWQQEHQLGLSYGFSPEEFKSKEFSSDHIFSAPLISNYGAYYRLPFGQVESVEQRISGQGSFGYDEATRQFRLPPAGSRPDVTVYASASASDTGVKPGPLSIVQQTPLLTIASQDTGQNLSINDSFGGRLNIPVVLGPTRRLSISAGPDVKRYLLESYNTNNFIITTVVTNSQGSQTISTVVPNAQPTRRNDITYVPLSVNVDYSQTDAGGSFTAGLAVSGNFVGEDGDFAALAYSPEARSEYIKATLSLTRDQKIFRDWSVLVRASGQISEGALLSNEQFALGGLQSVRGYYEGDEYGDSGWFSSLEARTPLTAFGVPAWREEEVPVWIRGSAFVDYGQRFLYETGASTRQQALWGAGLGVSANLDNRFDMRIIVGWPLIDTPNTKAGSPRAYFSIGGQF